MRTAAVFLDLDGTLIDYEGCVAEALEHAWARLQPTATYSRDRFLAVYHAVHRGDEAAQLAGQMTTVALLDRRDRFRRVLEALGAPDARLAAELGEGYERARRERTRPLPGADRTLAWLRGLGDVWVAVVTEGSGANQRAQLDRLGLSPLLDDVVVSREVGFHKPDPALVRLAVERSGVSPGRSAFVGDRPLWDLAPARQLGLATALLRSERYEPELAANPECADAVVDDHAALRVWLERWYAHVVGPGRGPGRGEG